MSQYVKQKLRKWAKSNGFTPLQVLGTELSGQAAGYGFAQARRRFQSTDTTLGGPTPQKKQKTLQVNRGKFTQSKNMPGNPVNYLVNKSSMKVKGKLKIKRQKRMKLSKKFVSGVKQVLQGQSAYGTYTTIKHGYVGSLFGSSRGQIAGDDMGHTQSQVLYNDVDAIAGRTLFNQLVYYKKNAATSGIVPGTGLNFFTPAKILDAASVLFNHKNPTSNPYLTTGNLSTIALVDSGAPSVSGNVGNLKITVVKSYVEFTIKNVSSRVVCMDIWECQPTLKFVDNNPLANAQSVALSTVQTSTNNLDTNLAYYAASAMDGQQLLHDIKFDPLAIVKPSTDFKWKWKKRSMVLAPEESCVHSINGPSGTFDYSKLLVTNFASPTPGTYASYGSHYKGWSVGCVISVCGDQVLTLDSTASAGGRDMYQVSDTPLILGMPVNIEMKEVYTIKVPEVAGFIDNAGAAGSLQQLNLRKRKDVIFNMSELGMNVYQVGNEENPLSKSTSSANQNQ